MDEYNEVVQNGGSQVFWVDHVFDFSTIQPRGRKSVTEWLGVTLRVLDWKEFIETGRVNTIDIDEEDIEYTSDVIPEIDPNLKYIKLTGLGTKLLFDDTAENIKSGNVYRRNHEDADFHVDLKKVTGNRALALIDDGYTYVTQTVEEYCL